LIFPHWKDSVEILRTQDTSDPRYFSTSATMPIRHFDTSAELSWLIGTPH